MTKLELEREVFAGVLYHFSENAPKFLVKFREDDFDDPRHRKLYSVIEKWYNDGGKTSFNLNNVSAIHQKDIDEIGSDYILSDIVADSIHFNSYDEQAEALEVEVTKSNIVKGVKHALFTMKTDFHVGLDEVVNIVNDIYDRAKVKPTHNLYDTFIEAIDPDKNDGVSMGFDKVHHLAGKFYPGQLIIVAGRPGMGKTTLALNWLLNYICMNKKKALLFSLEMSIKELLVKMISTVSEIPMTHLKDANLTKEERHVAELNMRKLSSNPYLVLFEDHVTDINSIKAAIREQNRKGQVGLVVVDYLQLITCASGKSIYEKVSEISRQLKTIALQYNCIVIALSQMNRTTEDKADKRPSMSELRGSGSIEQDANKVILLYRDDYYNRDSKTSNLVPIELDVAKNREGATGTVDLVFDLTTGKFYETEDE